MSAPDPQLEPAESEVFSTVRQRIAMPLLEVSATTKTTLRELLITLDKLKEKKLVTIEGGDDPLSAIISVNKKFL